MGCLPYGTASAGSSLGFGTAREPEKQGDKKRATPTQAAEPLKVQPYQNMRFVTWNRKQICSSGVVGGKLWVCDLEMYMRSSSEAGPRLEHAGQD